MYGGKNHTNETCWHVVRFPKNHSKNIQQMRKPGRDGGVSQGGGNKWNKPRPNSMAANAQLSTEKIEQLLSLEQVQQLLKLLPSGSNAMKQGSDTEEEIDSAFGSMVTCCNASFDA